jgi:Mg/Co/Ni transporter MgtE
MIPARDEFGALLCPACAAGLADHGRWRRHIWRAHRAAVMFGAWFWLALIGAVAWWLAA